MQRKDKDMDGCMRAGNYSRHGGTIKDRYRQAWAVSISISMDVDVGVDICLCMGIDKPLYKCLHMCV